MSTTIDNKVVKMTFDNKSFEKGVDDTLKTIDKLNKSLEFKDASKGFDNIEKSADNVDFKKLEQNIQTLSDRFSGLGIIGMQIWSKIGDAAWDMITGPFRKVESAISSVINSVETKIVQGGWNRALNLDKAENMIKNLGYAWESTGSEMAKVWDINNKQWKESTNIYKYVDAAVSGTAYSLDEAAVATGNLLPTLSKLGDVGPQVTDTLRAIMGVASTYSKDFNQISNYFQKVATKGSLGKDVASYMTQVGIEVYDTMQQYLGLTADQLDTALEKGLISFEMFRDAYLEKFGDSLDKANDTYEGAVANMGSAFSRIGAKFSMPLLDYLIDGANAVRIFANQVNKDISTSTDLIVKDLGKIGYDFLETFVVFKEGEDGIKRVNGLTEKGANLAKTIARVFELARGAGIAVAKVLGIIGEAFSRVFLQDGKKSASLLDKMHVAVWRFIRLLDKHHDFIVEGISGFFYLIKAILGVVKILLPIALKLIGVVIKIATALALLAGKIITTIVESKIFKALIEGISKIFKAFEKAVTKVKDSIAKFIKSLNLGEKAAKAFDKIWNGITKTFKIVSEALEKAFKASVDGIKEFNEKYHPVTVALDAIKKGFDFVYDAVKKAIEKIAEFIGTKIELPTLDDIKAKLDEFKDKIVWAFQNPKEAADLLLDSLKKVADFITTGFKDAVDIIVEKTKKFTDWLGEFKDGFDKSKKSMEEFSDSEAMEKTEKKLSVMERLSKAMDGIATAFERMWKTLQGIGKKVLDGINWLIDEVGDFLDIHSLQDLIKVLGQLVKLAIGYNWSQAGAGLGYFLGTISKSIREGLGTNVSILKTLPDAILKMAEALAIMGAVVVVLGSMNKDAIEQAKDVIGYLAVLITVMVICIKYLGMYRKYSSAAIEIIGKDTTTKVSGPFANRLMNFISGQLGTSMQLTAAAFLIKSVGASLLEVAISLAILGKALKNSEGEIDWDSIKNLLGLMAGMIVGIAVLMFVVIKAAGKMNKFKDNSRSNGSDFKTSGLLGILFKFLFSHKVDVKDIETMSETGGTPGQIASAALFVLATGAAMMGMAVALSVLSLLPEDGLRKGMNAFVGLTAIMVILMYMATKAGGSLLDKNGDITKMSKSSSGGQLAGLAAFIIALSAALLLMTPTVIILGNIPLDKLAKGVGALSIMGIVMSFAARLAGKSEHGFNALTSIIGVAISLKLVASALKDVSEGYSDDSDSMGAAIGVLVTMAILMGVLIFLSSDAKSAIATAGSMIAFGAAMYACALAFAKIQDACDGTGDGLATFVIMVVLMCIVVAGLGALVSKFPGLGGGMLAVSGALLMLGAGIFLVAAALQMLWPLIDDISEKKDTFAQALADFAEIAAMALLRFFTYFLESLAAESVNLVNSIGTLLLNLIVGIINFLAANATTLGVAIGHFIAAVIVIVVAAIITLLADIWIVLKDWVPELFKNIGKVMAKPFEGLIKIIFKALEFIGTWIGLSIADVVKAVVEWIKSLVKLFTDLFKDIKTIFEKIWNVMKNPFDPGTWKELAGSVVDAVCGIFKNSVNLIQKACNILWGPIKNLQDNAVKAFETILGSTAPKFVEKDARAAELAGEIGNAISTSKAYQQGAKGVKENEKKLEAYLNKYTKTETKTITDYNHVTGYKNGRAVYATKKVQTKTLDLSDIIDTKTGRFRDDYQLNDALKKKKYELATIIQDLQNSEQSMQSAISDVFDHYEKYNEDLKNYLYAEINGVTIKGDSNAQTGYSAGALLGQNVIRGLNAGLNLTNIDNSFLEKFLAGAKSALGIASPSKVFKWIGDMVMQGFGIGIDDGAASVDDIFATALSNIEDMAENATVTPVFDLSEIQNESEQAAAAMLDMKTNIPQEVDLLNNTNANKIDTLDDSVNGLSDSLSTSTLEQIITTQNDMIQALSNKLNDMGVYIDGRTLVGSILSDVDKGLGSKVGQIGRSVMS